jgi:SRSO17 transposase
MSLLEHKEARLLLEDAEVSASTVRGCRRRLTRFLERYLPRQWAESTARRRKCHVPGGVRFAEKWQLGLKLIEQARQVPHRWVVADDEFGRVSQLRAKLRRRRQRRPRQPPWVRADTWAADQPASRWQQIEVRAGEKGPLVVEVLHAMVETSGKAQERLVVIRTVESSPKTHYTLSNAAADLPVEQIVWAHDDRHRIEELFELGNGEVGLDHYEVRSWVGWHHHMTLSLLALWFLVQERQRVGEKNTGDYGATGSGDLQPTAPTASAHGNNDCRNHQRRVAA